MGLFYKYKCKKCGKRYFELPINCDNCGTKLSFICPLSMWFEAIRKRSEYCEEIHEFFISFHKSKKTRELEEKINGLNAILSERYEEIEELNNGKKGYNEKIRNLIDEIRILNMKNSELSSEILHLKIAFSNKEIDERFSSRTSIPDDTMQAVKYAMKHAHPDNGGNAEDFIKFQKCYEELTRK